MGPVSRVTIIRWHLSLGCFGTKLKVRAFYGTPHRFVRLENECADRGWTDKRTWRPLTHSSFAKFKNRNEVFQLASFAVFKNIFDSRTVRTEGKVLSTFFNRLHFKVCFLIKNQEHTPIFQINYWFILVLSCKNYFVLWNETRTSATWLVAFCSLPPPP